MLMPLYFSWENLLKKIDTLIHYVIASDCFKQLFLLLYTTHTETNTKNILFLCYIGKTMLTCIE